VALLGLVASAAGQVYSGPVDVYAAPYAGAWDGTGPCTDVVVRSSIMVVGGMREVGIQFGAVGATGTVLRVDGYLGITSNGLGIGDNPDVQVLFALVPGQTNHVLAFGPSVFGYMQLVLTTTNGVATLTTNRYQWTGR